MPAIRRKGLGFKIPAASTLAAANSLSTSSTAVDVSGSSRVVIVQINNGTDGTAGIDTIQISKDGGKSYAADDTLLALASDDSTGTVVVNGVLNVAGTEALGAAVFKSGPHDGPTLMRCSRLATQDANSVAWVTGAPQTIAVVVGA